MLPSRIGKGEEFGLVCNEVIQTYGKQVKSISLAIKENNPKSYFGGIL